MIVKWFKTKNQLSLICMEITLGVPKSPKLPKLVIFVMNESSRIITEVSKIKLFHFDSEGWFKAHFQMN